MKRFRKSFVLIMIALTVAIVWYGLRWMRNENISKEIRLGISLPLSSINEALGKSVLQGAQVAFRVANAQGGIAGKPIRLIAYDDKYEPQITLANTHKLLEKDRVFALFGFVGTPTVKKILPIIGDTPFVAPYTGASFLRDPSWSNLVNFRSSYRDEIQKIVDYLVAKRAFKQFAIFYQNDDYGIEGYNAAVTALRKYKLSLVGEGTYKRNTLSVRHALNEIKGSHPDAIIIVGAYKPSAYFIREARRCCDAGVVFAPISFVNADALVAELGNATEGILFSQTVPAYDDQTIQAVRSFRRDLAHFAPKSKPTFAALEGYLAARAVVAALRKQKGQVNRKSFLRTLKNLRADDLEGLPIRYQNTQLLNQVYLSTFHDGAFHPLERSGGGQ